MVTFGILKINIKSAVFQLIPLGMSWFAHIFKEGNMANFNQRKLIGFGEFCGNTWCEWHDISITDNIMRITTTYSKWLIHLDDFDKFGRYILWHYSSERGTNQYHRQRAYKSIYNLVASAMAHDFDKQYQIDFTFEDFKRIKSDFERTFI